MLTVMLNLARVGLTYKNANSVFCNCVIFLSELLLLAYLMFLCITIYCSSLVVKRLEIICGCFVARCTRDILLYGGVR